MNNNLSLDQLKAKLKELEFAKSFVGDDKKSEDAINNTISAINERIQKLNAGVQGPQAYTSTVGVGTPESAPDLDFKEEPKNNSGINIQDNVNKLNDLLNQIGEQVNGNQTGSGSFINDAGLNASQEQINKMRSTVEALKRDREAWENDNKIIQKIDQASQIIAVADVAAPSQTIDRAGRVNMSAEDVQNSSNARRMTNNNFADAKTVLEKPSRSAKMVLHSNLDQASRYEFRDLIYAIEDLIDLDNITDIVIYDNSITINGMPVNLRNSSNEFNNRATLEICNVFNFNSFTRYFTNVRNLEVSTKIYETIYIDILNDARRKTASDQDVMASMFNSLPRLMRLKIEGMDEITRQSFGSDEAIKGLEKVSMLNSIMNKLTLGGYANNNETATEPNEKRSISLAARGESIRNRIANSPVPRIAAKAVRVSAGVGAFALAATLFSFPIAGAAFVGWKLRDIISVKKSLDATGKLG